MHSDSTIFRINAASCMLSARVYVELDFFAFLLGCFSAPVHFDLKVTSLPDKNECGNVFQINRRRLVCVKPAGGLEAPLLPSLNSHPAHMVQEAS